MQRFTCDICGKEFFGEDSHDDQLLCFNCGAELADEVVPVINDGDDIPAEVLAEMEGGGGGE